MAFGFKEKGMRRLASAIACVAIAAGTIAGIALGAGETTGTNTACATATAPGHSVAVDQATVTTIAAVTKTSCHTVTYTIPTSTTTVTATGTTSTTSSTTTTTPSGSCPVAQPQTTWAAVGTAGPQMTDAQAAVCVQHVAEAVPGNQQYDNYVPTSSEETAWQTAAGSGNQEHTPEVTSVDGLDGLFSPSTDDLIQWASYKWGIPTNWIRAEAMQESHWDFTDPGDVATVSSSDYAKYPALGQLSGPPPCNSNCQAARSLGLMQVSWTPEDDSTSNPGFGYGVNPLRTESMAFNLDFYGAVIRWYYNGDCGWCSPNPKGQQWTSIGAWFEPPGNSSGSQTYISDVQQHLSAEDWPGTGGK